MRAAQLAARGPKIRTAERARISGVRLGSASISSTRESKCCCLDPLVAGVAVRCESSLGPAGGTETATTGEIVFRSVDGTAFAAAWLSVSLGALRAGAAFFAGVVRFAGVACVAFFAGTARLAGARLTGGGFSPESAGVCVPTGVVSAWRSADGGDPAGVFSTDGVSGAGAVFSASGPACWGGTVPAGFGSPDGGAVLRGPRRRGVCFEE